MGVCTVQPLVRIQGLAKTFGEGETRVEAVRGLNLELGRGEIVLVMGPSGSGKTTFLSMLGGPLIAAGPVATVTLLLVLALQASLTAAETGASGASSSRALQGHVRIHLQGWMSGPQFAAVGQGRFTASGAITDRGRFVDKFEGIHPPGEPRDRTLLGSKGTIRLEVSRTGQWRVTLGTKAYSGLRGRGSDQGRYRFTGIDITMIGTVSR